MRELKLKIRRKILHPWMLKYKPECSVVLRDAIVYQMWAADISFPIINKWLAKMHVPTIKAYVMTKDGPRLFYKTLTSEEKANIVGRIINVI